MATAAANLPGIQGIKHSAFTPCITQAVGYILLFMMMITYTLPNGRNVQIPYDVCRAASTISYQLATGAVVTAVIAAGQR